MRFTELLIYFRQKQEVAQRKADEIDLDSQQRSNGSVTDVRLSIFK